MMGKIWFVVFLEMTVCSPIASYQPYGGFVASVFRVEEGARGPPQWR